MGPKLELDEIKIAVYPVDVTYFLFLDGLWTALDLSESTQLL